MLSCSNGSVEFNKACCCASINGINASTAASNVVKVCDPPNPAGNGTVIYPSSPGMPLAVSPGVPSVVYFQSIVSLNKYISVVNKAASG